MADKKRRAPSPKPAKGARGRTAPKPSPQGTLDPIITMDVSGTIQSASDDVEPLFGWTPDELCGHNVNMLIPEPRRSALDRYLDRYRNPGRAASLERTRRFDAVRKDGTLVSIELSVSRANLPGQAGTYFVGLIRDRAARWMLMPTPPRPAAGFRSSSPSRPAPSPRRTSACNSPIG